MWFLIFTHVVAISVGVLVGRQTKAEDDGLAALDAVYINMSHELNDYQAEVVRLKAANKSLRERRCHCADHLNELKRLN